MKRFFVILLLIPSLAFGAYTEFYCQNGGSNLNAGSTTNNTALYTSIHGNWTQATGVFTPTDGTTPASTVSSGMWAAVYVDGATVAASISRITNVAAGVNGAITANSSVIGSKPANQTGTATIKVGGAWKGPNAASGFPFTLTTWGANQDASGNQVRTNLKNDQTYSLTASFAFANTGSATIVQGYSSSVEDGGKATFDGGTSTGALISDVGVANRSFIDLIFTTSITSGSTDLVTALRSSNWIRCVFKGARQKGLSVIGASTINECEAYDNGKANNANQAGFFASGTEISFRRCVAHDNSGSNTSGFHYLAGGVTLDNCISDTNGKNGVTIAATSGNAPINIINSDIYNNGADGINIAASNTQLMWIENTNLIKNTGAGINNASTANFGFSYNNGYGAGTQANGSGDTLGNLSESGKITYASNVTPWADPANGDFRITLPAAYNVGRGAFQETQGYSSPNTVGYPDIGAANHNDTCGGTGPCQTSGASAY